MVNSRAEIQEESMLKVTAGSDQMHLEDDVEGIEEEIKSMKLKSTFVSFC